MTQPSKFAVKSSDLRWRCNPEQFAFETTDEVPRCGDIIGQDRGINAIKLGLEVKTRGYNIFVSGLTGTGKSTTIQRLLQGMKVEEKELTDICYVNNFKIPEMPICLSLPAGQGVRFKREMAQFFKNMKEALPEAMKEEAYKNRRKVIIEEIKERKIALANEFEKTIHEKEFALYQVQYGPVTHPQILPVIDGEAVELEKLPVLVEAGKITEEQLKTIQDNYSALTEELDEFLSQNRDLDIELTEKLATLEKQVISPALNMCIRDVLTKFNYEKVKIYLNDLREHVLENLHIFKGVPEETAPGMSPTPPKDVSLDFEVNVIVDNSRAQGAPVINETAPNYGNLFGTIERYTDNRGERRTDFTKIRAGSFVRANGGYLVLSLLDILEEPAVWPALKRALKNLKVTIQTFDSFLMMPVAAIKPEPIEIDVKVVLIGDANSYQILYHYDEEFRKIFKVKADFDSVMPNVEENVIKYSEFIRHICDEDKLLPFHKTAVAEIIEEGVKLAGRQDKLSTRFSDVADVIREASYWAGKEEAKVVEAKHVEKAIVERIKRVNLIEEKIDELIEAGTILIDTEGEKAGQINGLSVYDLGDHAFGKPSRITAETAMGRSGIINIEREADLSGKTHNKGVLILEGYLRRQYAQDKPLTMSASICFEQSYSGIDGDSASSTEVYALLSSLSEVPLRQDLAVTGSVNQKGEIQPIGGVNEKIEGFFDICAAKKLTSNQGVIIPALNKKDLMLRKDVLKAVEEGKFHIYAIRFIDEGIELLTGKKAGKRLKSGAFEKGSIHDLVNEKLRKYAEQIRDYYEPDAENE